MSAIQIIPYEIGPCGLMRLKEEKLQGILKKLDALSAPLENAHGIADAWHGFLNYYGADGFKNEIRHMMNRFENERAKGAAMLCVQLRLVCSAGVSLVRVKDKSPVA